MQLVSVVVPALSTAPLRPLASVRPVSVRVPVAATLKCRLVRFAVSVSPFASVLPSTVSVLPVTVISPRVSGSALPESAAANRMISPLAASRTASRSDSAAPAGVSSSSASVFTVSTAPGTAQPA